MPEETEYIFMSKRAYQVQCPFDKEHLFTKIFEFERGTDFEPPETIVDTFCPFCDKMVEIKVTGKAPTDEKLVRRFREQDERLAKKYKRRP